jgi:hypothetical protein
VSQQPAPTPSEAARKPKAEATQQQEKAEPDKRATKDSPAIVEISETPLIRVEAAGKAEKARDYTPSEWWLGYITGTFFLTLYTLWKALDIGKESDRRLDSWFCPHGKRTHGYHDELAE